MTTKNSSLVNPVTAAEMADSKWKSLYKIGGAAALVTAALIVAGVITFLAWPPPLEGTVTDWFALFQRSWLIGMLDLDLVMLLSYVALIPMALALYVALRPTSESLMAIAIAFTLVAAATYFASSRVFEMLALSQQYATATADAERSILVAAGQSMLTTYLGAGGSYQGTAFNMSFVLWSAAGVMFSAVMVRNGVFGKVSGYLGIVAFLAAFGLFVPGIGIFLSLVSLVFQLVWLILIGQKLFHLSR